ncbi:ubiquitin domain containing protein, putative [Babesia ovata]|uniref:Ubiquitin domain containing protein, putative n=1 Tax=Babesia ovata TaxID=189622 RepID=A0A2H6K7W5_9APIC|nr:ubiquitin domain containing protein, putative [Babesia ovata]GBE59068.1 ubiquitin domain containing protein, putative [Babesia ovata]
MADESERVGGSDAGTGADDNKSIDESSATSSSKKNCRLMERGENAPQSDAPSANSENGNSCGVDKDGGVPEPAAAAATESVAASTAPAHSSNDTSVTGRSNSAGGSTASMGRPAPGFSHIARRLMTDSANINVDELVQAMDAHQPSSGESEDEKEDRMRLSETQRMLRELTADSDLMNQVMRAATNPEMAKELARQADTAWRNIEAVPGGFRALYQMHRNIQQPLWQAMMNDGQRASAAPKRHGKSKLPDPKEKLSVEALPNPWATPPSTFSASPGMPSSLGGLGGRGNSANIGGLANLLSALPISSSRGSSKSNESPNNLGFMSTLNPYMRNAGAGSLGSSGASGATGSGSSSSAPSGRPSVGSNSAPTSQDAASTPPEAPTPNVTGATVTPAEVTTPAGETADAGTEKYAEELAQLEAMGLHDRDRCITALEASDGDLFTALGLLETLEELDKVEPGEDA